MKQLQWLPLRPKEVPLSISKAFLIYQVVNTLWDGMVEPNLDARPLEADFGTIATPDGQTFFHHSLVFILTTPLENANPALPALKLTAKPRKTSLLDAQRTQVIILLSFVDLTLILRTLPSPSAN